MHWTIDECERSLGYFGGGSGPCVVGEGLLFWSVGDDPLKLAGQQSTRPQVFIFSL